MNSVSKISILASIFVAAGCAEQPGTYSQYGQTTGYTDQVVSSPRASDIAPPPPGTQPLKTSDSALGEQVRQSLTRSSVSEASRDVNIVAQDGSVTLTGTVPDEIQRRQIDEVVRNTPGVTAVYDQLQAASPGTTTGSTYAPVVTPPATPQPTGRAYENDQPQTYQTQTSPVVTGNNMSTGDIFNLHVQGLNDTDRSVAERILHGLRTDTALTSLLPVVNIQVVNGRVILQGRVQNEQQRQTIGSVVERAAGGGRVENELQVAP